MNRITKVWSISPVAVNDFLSATHTLTKRIFATLFLLSMLALPSSLRADLTSDSRAAAGVISNYIKGVTLVLGNSVIQKVTGDAIDLTTQAFLTQAALKNQTQSQLALLADGTSLAFILKDLISLDGDMRAAAAGDRTKAASLITASKDIWDLFWIIATRTGMQSSGILPSGGFLTAFGAANSVIGTEFFIVGQVLNMELGIVDYGMRIINIGLDAREYALCRAKQGFFSDTEKALLNDYLLNTVQYPYNPLQDLLTSGFDIRGYTPKEHFKVFEVVANYPGFLFTDPRTWVVAADAKVVITNNQKSLRIAMWTYKRSSLNDIGTDYRPLPQVSVQLLTNGVWTTISLGTTTKLWGSSNTNAPENTLYGPNCTASFEIPLPPNSTNFPSEVRTLWTFPGAPDTTTLTIFRFADIQATSANLSGKFLTGQVNSNLSVSIPLTLTSALGVENLELSLTSFNTTNNPPVLPTNVVVRFAGFPTSLTKGQTVNGTINLTFSPYFPPGRYTGILRVDALNATPLTLAVSVDQNYHPADTSRDWQISFTEYLAYANCWRNSCTCTNWQYQPPPGNVSLSYYLNAANIWKSGPLRYHYVVGAKPPLCWVPGPAAALGPIPMGADPSTGSATRILPPQYTPGTPFQVTINVTPPAGNDSLALEEHVPLGWLVTNISERGVCSPVDNIIRWGAFDGATNRVLTYTVIPPVSEIGDMATFGEAGFIPPLNILTIDGSNTIPITPLKFSFNDGIPDFWREHYFGTSVTTNELTCATCDASRTGQNNYFKYLAGLDPTNPASVFQFGIANNSSQYQCQLIFGPTAQGRIYTPLFCSNLVNGTWSTLTGFSMETNGSQIILTDSNENLEQKFYRVKISLP